MKRDRSSWLKGPTACCNLPPRQVNHPWRLVLLGAPGVGKGTQAELLAERLGSCHLSTGDVFRAAKSLADADRSPAIDAALDFMRRGQLVPDETVLDMVRERVRCLRCSGGFLLDGFPRTVNQAEALTKILADELISLDGVLSYEVPLEAVVARLSGRRTCSGCKAVFHVAARPPRVEGVCDHCGAALYQREDDQPASIRVRLDAYSHSTAPLIEYYDQRNLLRRVPADGGPEEIYRRSLAALDAEGPDANASSE